MSVRRTLLLSGLAFCLGGCSTSVRTRGELRALISTVDDLRPLASWLTEVLVLDGDEHVVTIIDDRHWQGIVIRERTLAQGTITAKRLTFGLRDRTKPGTLVSEEKLFEIASPDAIDMLHCIAQRIHLLCLHEPSDASLQARSPWQTCVYYVAYGPSQGIVAAEYKRPLVDLCNLCAWAQSLEFREPLENTNDACGALAAARDVVCSDVAWVAWATEVFDTIGAVAAKPCD